MSDHTVALKVEHISKVFRIGAKESLHDNLVGMVFDFIRNPIRNFQTYRSLYRFDESELNEMNDRNDPSSTVLWAVKDVSFDVRQGEVVGIIGRNGAGKSTLLKILCRITDPTKGRAIVRGRISSLLEVGTGFHPELTGKENIFLNGTILGMKKKEVEKKFDEIVSFSGVEKFIYTPVKRYSSGMKVRLAFSVAAHLEPEVLIIDEVLAVGDADFQKKCLEKMEDVGKLGRTVLFVSHNMPAIARICERVICMESGSVVDQGTSAEVISRYMNAGTGTNASRVWPDPDSAPQSDMARLHAVHVKNEIGDITNTIDIRKPVTLEMQYDALKDNYILMPHFGLKNEYGDSVFVTIDQDPTWRNRPRPRGRYTSSVVIPGNLLAEGTFFVNANMMTLNPNMLQFREESAVSFLVVDSLDGNSARGDYLGVKFPGIVRPLLKWFTQQCD